jgi:small GTP-binding protein
MKEPGEDSVPHYKVVIFGNSQVGKTSIVLKWVNNSFSEVSKPTIGSNHHRKRIDLDGTGPVDLYVWDTAGQEQFQALMPLYARSSSFAIMTTAIDDMKSFDAIPTWTDAINSSSESPPPVVLAVNKMDLVGSEVFTVEEIHEKYDKDFLGVFFVSALSGEQIPELFRFAAVEASKFKAKRVNQNAKMLESSGSESTECC